MVHESFYWIVSAMLIVLLPWLLMALVSDQPGPSQGRVAQIAGTIFVVSGFLYLLALVVRYLVFLIGYSG